MTITHFSVTHNATHEQRAGGVVDLAPTERAQLTELLTFDEPPSSADIVSRAHDIALLASMQEEFCPAAMIGGAGYLMAELEMALLDVGIEPLHAFTRRESVEVAGADGAVTKTAVFRHVGFVSPRGPLVV